MTLGGVTATYPMFSVPPPPAEPSKAKFENLDQLFAFAPDSLFEFFQNNGFVETTKSAMTDPQVAEETFVRSLLNDEMLFGNGFLNQLVMRRLGTNAELDAFLAKFCASSDCSEVGGERAKARWQALVAKKGLFVIDLSMFESIPPGSPVGQDLHIPGVMMILERTDRWNFAENPWAGFASSSLEDDQGPAMSAEPWQQWWTHFQDRAKTFVKASTAEREMKIQPSAVRLSDFQGANVQHYTRATCTPTAWALVLYASKPAMTAYGVIGGHMFHWHIIPGALVRGFFNNVAPQHPLFDMLKPISEYVNGWNTLLFGAWGTNGNTTGIGPPVTVKNAAEILTVMEMTGAARAPFRELHPEGRARHLGLETEEVDEGKNRVFEYENVQLFAELWDIAEEYCQTIVDDIYADDAAVAGDVQLQAWMAAVRDPANGNIPDLGDVLTKADLVYVLAYMQAMVFEHGVSRVWAFSAASMTFMPAMSPTCLMTGALPDPSKNYAVSDLLNTWVPDMSVMSEWTYFITIFVLNPPAVPFLPTGGGSADLFFEGGVESPRNAALIKEREDVVALLRRYIEEKGYCTSDDAGATEACVMQQISQFPRNTEM